MTKENNKKKFSGIVIFLVICLALGFALGFLSRTLLKDFMDTYIKSKNVFITLLKVYGLIFIFFIGFLIHIIIHEAGHLVFGLITGYSFRSFRIASLTLVREDNKFKLKRFNIPGTGGQCLMMPPPLKEGNFPYVLYNLGGVIMNFSFSAAGIAAAILFNSITFPINAILVLVSVAGFFAFLTNGIPLKIGGIPNDAFNVLSMLKDKDSRTGFYLQLRVNGLLSSGTRIKSLPLEMFNIKEGADLSNPLNTSLKLMQYSWYLDNLDLDNAKQCIDSLVPYLDELAMIFKYEINCERIFLELVGDCDKDFIDNLYDSPLKKYIKASKYMISKKRLLMTYEGFYNKDLNKALEHYEAAKTLAKKYPIKGDAEMELMLMDWVNEKLKNNISEE